ncbi:MAG TPA: sugar phosphate isomerase/epimerase [Planctomycetota bacterium]|nr:sugar phosphate isomerase/epimerase [Planctomycetota bacterium]
MKLGFSTLGCPDWTIEEIAANAGKYGFDGVELRTHTDGRHFKPDASLAEAGKVGELFRSRGTRVFSLSAYTRFGSTDRAELATNRDTLLHVLDLAKAVGADFVRTFAGQFGNTKTRERAVADAAEHLIPCCAKAREVGVALGVETHDDWCDPAMIRALQERVGKGFGVVWDFPNAIRVTGKGVREQFDALKGSLLYCHVKDWRREDDGKHRLVRVGTGEVPVREAVELLRENDLDLFLCFEHEKMWHPELPDPAEAFPAYVSTMRRIL